MGWVSVVDVAEGVSVGECLSETTRRLRRDEADEGGCAELSEVFGLEDRERSPKERGM